MARTKFIKEKVFGTKKVEDIIEDLYNDFRGQKDEIDELIGTLTELTKGDLGLFLQSLDQITKILTVQAKNTTNIVAVLGHIQRDSATGEKEGKDTNLKELDDLESLLKQAAKNGN